MSKVAIVGDPSGTGTFTISAPNGNTDRTLVLPDEAGTVLTTAGVPASAMPAGSVIQHKYAIIYPTGDISTTSSTPVEVSTSLRVSLQMLNTSNYVVMRLSTTGSGYVSGPYLYLDIKDVSSGSFTSDAMGFIGPNGLVSFPCSGTRIVSGADWGASSRTVSMYFSNNNNSGTVYANWAGSSAIMSIEVMEIAA